MPHQVTLKLSSDQRTELEHARDHDERPYFRERCAAILKVAGGMSCAKVAAAGLLKPRYPDTVARWVKAYRERGVPGLVQGKRGHRGYSPRTR